MIKPLVYDPGFVETGKVVYDEARSEYLIRTELGDFSVQDFLKTQYGSLIRMTGIRVESLEFLRNRYSDSDTTPST